MCRVCVRVVFVHGQDSSMLARSFAGRESVIRAGFAVQWSIDVLYNSLITAPYHSDICALV